MNATEKTFDTLAQGLVPSKNIDSDMLRLAKKWYRNFAGPHAVTMEDQDLIEIFTNLNSVDDNSW